MSSSKNAFTISSLDEGIELAFEELTPEEKYCTNFEVRVFAVNGLDERTAEVAFLSGTSMEAEATLIDVDSFLELCNMGSMDLCQMAESITDSTGNVKKRMPAGTEHYVYPPPVC